MMKAKTITEYKINLNTSHVNVQCIGTDKFKDFKAEFKYISC